MDRRVIFSLIIGAAVANGIEARAGAGGSSNSAPLQRFFEGDHRGPHQYRALRHFEARTEKLDKSAWMDVWTEADPVGFRYDIVGEGGSGYIRSHVFEKALETERKMWSDGSAERGAINLENYAFLDCDTEAEGLSCVTLKPRRKDVLLVDGSIFLHPDTGDLVRVEGTLVKTPSFWTRSVEILRRYERISGVRVPVEFASTASVRLAGFSTFRVTYEYESLNGTRVGAPAVSSKDYARR
jgi:hypothetical protein